MASTVKRPTIDPEFLYNSTQYLSNTKGPVELLGIGPLVSPFCDHVSAQRAVMFSAHLPQAQTIQGSETPKLMTGYEAVLGQYEYSTTERTQDIQVEATIPKFKLYNGIRELPYITVIYRGLEDGTIDCFNVETYTFRSEGYGYRNQLLDLSGLAPGRVIRKDEKLSTSPSHKGNSYCMGTNAKVAYMGIPQVSEDAFVISQSLARKLAVTGVGKIELIINPYQIPRNLYGEDGTYKFIPDLGQEVNSEGLLAAVCTPTDDSFIFDLAPMNLSKPNYLHDSLFYVPVKSKIIDIDVYINTKINISSRVEFFQQALDYQQALNDYYLAICAEYLRLKKENKTKLSPRFNTLVTTAISILLTYGVKIPGLEGIVTNVARKARLNKGKIPIEFIYMVITYTYPQDVKPGMKLTGTCGNKGVISTILPDECMPVDQEGIRADLIIDPASVVSRMNPAQWYVQFFNRGARLLEKRIAQLPPLEGYRQIIEYIGSINPKWAELVDSLHPTDSDKEKLVKESLRSKEGIISQASPLQAGIDQYLVMEMAEKFNISKSIVTFSLPVGDGYRTYTSKQPVMIGDIYIYHLYKLPHERVVSAGYTSQHGVPMRGNKKAKYNHPYSPTTIRWGEDEIRNLIMAIGPETTARILGLYANTPEAVEKLIYTLLNDDHPGQIEEIGITTDEIFKGNIIVNITKHMNSCIGIDLAPPDIVTPEEGPYDHLSLSDSLKLKKRKVN